MKTQTLSLILFIFLNTTLYAKQPKNSFKESVVTQVYDGDTISVLNSNGTSQVIRLALIDSPELNQTLGDRAKRNLEKLILDKKVKYQVVNTDAFNRTNAIIHLSSININQKQIHDGYAWATQRNNSNQYLSLELQARKYRKGIWNTSNPLSPWIFRKQFFDAIM